MVTGKPCVALSVDNDDDSSLDDVDSSESPDKNDNTVSGLKDSAGGIVLMVFCNAYCPFMKALKNTMHPANAHLVWGRGEAYDQ